MGRRRKPPRREHRPLSIGGSHWRADGAPKTRFSTRQEAAGAAQHRWMEDRVELNVYQCEYCHGWHMGRSSRDE